MTVKQIPVDEIRPDPHNVRRTVNADKNAFDQLVQSVQSVGVLEPVIVRRDEEGLILVAGHRRLAAAIEAGLEKIPADERKMTDREVVEFQLIENLHREDIDPVEEASGYFRLVELGMTKKELAGRIGRSQAHVSQRLKLLQLPPKVLAQVKRNKISVTNALTLVDHVGEPYFDSLISEAEYGDVTWKASRAKTQYEKESAAAAAVAELSKAGRRIVSKIGYDGRYLEWAPQGDDPQALDRDNWQPVEDTRGWAQLSDLGLTEEQVAEHLDLEHTAFLVGLGDTPVIPLTTDSRATKKHFGIKATPLTDEQLAEREAKRAEREAVRARVEAMQAALVGKLPESAGALDELARAMAVDGAHLDVQKKAVELLGVEKPEDATYYWHGDHLKAMVAAGGTEARRAILALWMGRQLFMRNISAIDAKLEEWG